MQAKALLATMKKLAVSGRWCVSVPTIARFHPEPGKALYVSLCRHSKAGVIQRAAPGLYLNPYIAAPPWALERLISFLRPQDFYYVSLESALHEHGRMSQIPSRLTVMTTGRRHVQETCFGVVEFTHTDRRPELWARQTVLIPERQIRVASPELALRDLRQVGRNLDLVTPEDDDD